MVIVLAPRTSTVPEVPAINVPALIVTPPVNVSAAPTAGLRNTVPGPDLTRPAVPPRTALTVPV